MVVVSIIMLRVVPAFGEFYSQFGQELPLSTRVIVAISSFASSYFLPIVIVVALVAVGHGSGCSGLASGSGSIAWFCGCPALGGIAQKFATSQAARTLATLLGGGIPLVNAIDVSARSIRNRYMARELRSGGAAGARGPGAGVGDVGQRRVPGRRHQDGRGR